MFGTHFYHKKLRKSVAVFGALFNNLYVIRTDASNQVISQIKVPLSYGPKRKFLSRIRENPDLDTDTKVSIKLPRMSFEITSIQYDASRQLQKANNFNQRGSGSGSRNKFNVITDLKKPISTIQISLEIFVERKQMSLRQIPNITKRDKLYSQR